MKLAARVVGASRPWARRAARAAALVPAVFFGGCALAPPATPADPGEAEMVPGLRYTVASPWPASRVHLVRVDLRRGSFALRLSAPEERGRTIDAMADTARALVSVNVSFFDRRYVPRGLTVSDGRAWPEVINPAASPLLGCTVTLVCRVELEQTTAADPAWSTVIAGTPWLVRGGRARTEADDAGCPSLCARAHPRTVAGLGGPPGDRARYLFIATVEGRRGEVLGAALAPLAAWLVQQGVHEAINLDGGGSSTLWLQGAAAMNRPFNEPAERMLANVLHVLPAR